MRQDVKKIKQAIHNIEKFLPLGMYDHSLYATYLYTVRSHARGKLHMAVWNKYHPKESKFEAPQLWPNGTRRWPTHPRGLGHMEFHTLEDQRRWIAYVREYINMCMTEKGYNPWPKLELDFWQLEEEVVTGVA